MKPPHPPCSLVDTLDLRPVKSSRCGKRFARRGHRERSCSIGICLINRPVENTVSRCLTHTRLISSVHEQLLREARRRRVSEHRGDQACFPQACKRMSSRCVSFDSASRCPPSSAPPSPPTHSRHHNRLSCSVLPSVPFPKVYEGQCAADALETPARRMQSSRS